MILEVAALNIKTGQSEAFERAFAQAQRIISCMPGYVSHQLQRCLETPDKFLLLVEWQTLDDHIIGFRQSSGYQEWKQLLHHFYEPFPTVEHYTAAFAASISAQAAPRTSAVREPNVAAFRNSQSSDN